ncbi:MAG: response regulator [Rickettsiales bacterium]|nr:response regulator [Rickettsiales bacterium]
MTYAEDTEQFTRTFAEAILRDPMSWNGWQCLHMNMDNMIQSQKDPSIELHVMTLLDTYLSDYYHKCLFCGCDDFFIVAHDIPQNIIHDIGWHLSDILSAKFNQTPHISLYDVYAQHQEFSDILIETIGTTDQNIERLYTKPPSTCQSYRHCLTKSEGELLNVMIVEDEYTAAHLAMSCLKGSCTTRLEHDLQAAMLQCLKEFPDIVFLDINLPDGDGREMLSFIRANHPSTKVIMMTAHDEIETIVESLEMGASGFIRKPFKKEQIQHYVSQNRNIPIITEPRKKASN